MGAYLSGARHRCHARKRACIGVPGTSALHVNLQAEDTMAKAKSKQAQGAESVYRITELVGTSTVSWEDAAARAIETAAGSLRDLRVADIVKLDVKVADGKVVAYRARVALSFKYEA
jgi:flavin-binding protein dodecin